MEEITRAVVGALLLLAVLGMLLGGLALVAVLWRVVAWGFGL